jgi:hypothetical protein
VKSWWAGDQRVEGYMPKVRAAIERHVEDRDAVTDIYNRAYEAVYQAIVDHDKNHIRNVLSGPTKAGAK